MPLIAHPLPIVAAYGRGDAPSPISDLATVMRMDGVMGTSVAFGLLVLVLVYSLIHPWTSWNCQRRYAFHLAMYAAIPLALWRQVVIGGSLRGSIAFAQRPASLQSGFLCSSNQASTEC